MFNFNLRRISTRLYLGFALPAVALVVLGSYALYSFNRINQKVGTIYDDRVIPLEQLKRISDNYAVHVIDAVNKAHAEELLLSTATSQIQQAQTDITQTWELYQRTYLTPQEAALAAEAQLLFEQANAEIDRLLVVLRSGEVEALAAFDGPLYEVIDPLTAKLQELIDLQLQIAEAERYAAAALYQQTRRLFLVMLGFALILASPAGYIFSRMITKTLKETADAVAQALNEIAAATEEHERIAAQQASSVHETTATLDQLNSFAQESSQQAESVSQRSQQSLLLSQEGVTSAHQTLATMSALRHNSAAITSQINQLSAQVKQIGAISSLVNEISHQTNVLSLNAAVEAVRAGDHGKGFAVVAAEIRKLADQSKASSENISQLVKDIQNLVQATVVATEVENEQMQRSAQIVQTSAHNFSEVAGANEELVLSGKQICLGAEQQAQAIQEVFQAMQSLNAAAIETTNSLAQTRQGTQSLKATMARLQALV